MSDRRSCLGRRGEAAAEAFLARRGMTILDRRWRRPTGELDLVAQEGDLVVFVEVKTRSGRAWGRPAEAVGRLKRARLARTAVAYLRSRGWDDRACRFDVVEVEVSPDGHLVAEHLPGAFDFDGS